MENQNCSLINHKENKANSFCQDCKIYMCKKCESHHTELFLNHHTIKIDKDKKISENFIDICPEKNHPYELNFFCKTHNKLCCAMCITKIKGKEFLFHYIQL